MTTAVTKQDKVMNYLRRGNTLSQDSAFSMFGIGNLRATISDIRPMLRSNGFNIITTTGRNGETRYGLISNKKRR
jgi:hypothetical protein